MFSTPLICCSIGVTTVAATTSALAPGYWPVTVIVGGAISGYCATRQPHEGDPAEITNTTATTEAKIGRSMKKCDMRILPGRGLVRFLRRALARRRRRGFLLLRRHFLTGRAASGRDDHPVVGPIPP